MREKIIRKKLKELKEKFPQVDIENLEKELIPLNGKEIKIRKKKV
ncbi:MAG: hypothetical protein QXD89_00740 [Candidatus Aenigmatarchaeota archaeon]